MTKPIWAAILCAATALSGCATGPAPTPSVPARRPVSQNACPAVASVDLAALASAAAAPSGGGERRDLLATVQIPANAPVRPGPGADVIVRAFVPAGGMHPAETRSVVWREGGVWWFWRQHIDYSVPPPPLTPPPPGPEYEAWMRNPPPPPSRDEQFPPVSGRLDPEAAVYLDKAVADPCRQYDPDYWPVRIPLRRRVEGRRVLLCPPDSASHYGEIIEGGVARRVAAACSNDTPTFRILAAAISAREGYRLE